MPRFQNDVIDGCCHGTSRRRFCQRLAKLALTGAGTILVPSTVFALARQDNWRNCRKCRTLFFNGYRRGRCPAGGSHAGDDRNYKLTYDSPGAGQPEWRFCGKCDAFFYNGFASKGVCPAGGSHFAQGFNFSLRSDGRAVGEHEWRFCTKCEVLFHNASSSVGACAAGGGHNPAGNLYVLDDSVRID